MNQEDKSLCSHSDEAPLDIKTVDVAMYAGPMDHIEAADFLQWCRGDAKEGGTCFLLLATTGGSASVAYRISRALQRKYHRVFMAIPWICKSAGTLLCIGANGLAFGKEGELGPLDVQLPKKDEILAYASGLTPSYALSTLREESFAFFENVFLSILERGNGQISTSSAAKMAIRLTAPLMGEIYAQIDPLQLGQSTRDISIAREYGERLNKGPGNLKRGALNKLINGYPEHGFVIDIDEARSLFLNVFEMDANLNEIARNLWGDMEKAVFTGRGLFCKITEDQPINEGIEERGNEYKITPEGFVGPQEPGDIE